MRVTHPWKTSVIRINLFPSVAAIKNKRKHVIFLSGQTRPFLIGGFPHQADVRRVGFHGSIFGCLV